ncbi:MAG: hypothetical protein QM820_55585 [Minicystis sp.]
MVLVGHPALDYALADMRLIPPRLHLAALLSVAGLAPLTASACGGKVVVDASASAGGAGGSGGATGAGGAVACTEVSGLCETWCDGCGAKEDDHCLARCFGFYEGFYPSCANAYAARLACKVQHQNDPAGCGGIAKACAAEDLALSGCIQAHPGCNGIACDKCDCKTSCATVFETACDTAGMCTCILGGTVIGTCAEQCMSANMATCCAALFFQTCP